MTTTVGSHPWSKEALLGKAIIYVGRMESHTADDGQFGFWSALSLEILARAALAHISPILLADANNWRNLTHALGHAPTATKFSPSSIPTSEVLKRLKELVPDFTDEVASFCTKHADRRNSELHTGELAFDTLGTSEWLPKYYSTCSVLLEFMGSNLDAFVSNPEAAKAMISSFEDETAKAVGKDISAHAQVWSNKTDKEREAAVAQAQSWATKQSGHRVECPACHSAALVYGGATGTVTTKVNGDGVVQRQTMLPSSFECISCGLRISGLSKLSACGLGDAFTATFAYSAAEFFELYTEEEIEEAREAIPEWEPDFND